MLKRVVLLSAMVLLLFSVLLGTDTQAAGVETGCFVFTAQSINGKTVNITQGNTEWLKEVEKWLSQLKVQTPSREQVPPQQEAQPQEQQNENQSQGSTIPSGSNESVSALSADEQKMVDLVNQERSKQGLAPLKVDLELTKVARAKAQDMIDRGYFDHHSPTYGSPAEMLNKFGVSYRYMGENLAGNPSVEGAHQSLMNSSGHRANILNGQFGHVGIGIVNGGPYGKMFVQLFTD